MSTPENTHAPEEKKPDAPKAPKGPLIFGVVSVLNLALSGFIAANIAFATTEEYEEEVAAEDAHGAAEESGGHGEEKKDDGHGGGGGGHEESDGPIVTLDPFIVNLNEPGSNRYLKATFDVEMNSARGVNNLKSSKRNVRDEIFRYLSSLSVSDTLGESSKARIQREVLTRIEREIGRNMVKKLFFTEFVVQ
jgi:flagellar basal body-associated protein FliL